MHLLNFTLYRRLLLSLRSPQTVSVRTDHDYRQALKEVEVLMMAKENTPEGERLDVLVTLVENYEHQHYPMDAFAEKVSALDTEQFFIERKSRADMDAFKRVLFRAGGEKPRKDGIISNT